ncbi:MAG: c-type cytochrome [Ignavibacteria bacterium]|nr:c-type cytochrome [Ignavibacteria bacterium]
MKHGLFLIALCISALTGISACGNSEEKEEGEEAATPAVYGKIKEVQIDPTVNPEMAKKGEKIFGVICKACHKYDERYVGPALGAVTKRRTPVYIMNMILDTETMIQKDDTARCLLQVYLTKMPNTNVNETDARNVLEHLRDIGQSR